MAGDHKDDAELVGLVEPNPGRLSVHLNRLSDAGLDVTGVVTGDPDDLERVIKETRADRVIITSPDYTHADLIVRSLDAGVDVVVEKPLTIDPESTRRIAEAVATLRATGGRDPQLSLLPEELRPQGIDQERLDRHAAVGHVRMGARHRAWRGLLPPLAQGQGQLRWPAGSQGVAPLRPGQLAAR